MRRAFAGVAAVFATLAFAVPAHGARLVTLVTHSRYVDPAKVDFNLPQGTPPALRADVLLPTGYDGRRRYPVLYLLHGHGDAYNSWMDPKDGDVAHVAKGFYWTGHNPTALVRNLRRTRLFIAVGDGVPAPGDGVNYFGSLAEADLRMHAQDFVNAARSVGDDVTYDPRQGIHAWRYWRQHLTDALKWGFFRPVIAHTTR